LPSGQTDQFQEFFGDDLPLEVITSPANDATKDLVPPRSINLKLIVGVLIAVVLGAIVIIQISTIKTSSPPTPDLPNNQNGK